MGLHQKPTHICYSNICFRCPYCNYEFDDRDEIYYNRINKYKSGFTKKKCGCGHWFGITADMTSDLVGFKLK